MSTRTRITYPDGSTRSTHIDLPGRTIAMAPNGILSAAYTDERAVADGYVDRAEAIHDAIVNGWRA